MMSWQQTTAVFRRLYSERQRLWSSLSGTRYAEYNNFVYSKIKGGDFIANKRYIASIV